MVYLHRSSIYGISIHAPPRGATGLHFLCVGYSVFQFTPLREGRQNSRGNLRRYYKRFQFTPLREGRRRTPTTKTTERLFQFTPLREGRHAVHFRPEPGEDISIHAPPRGATVSCSAGIAGEQISIHAPPRGATRRPSSRRWCWMHFNSRPSARGDQLSQKKGSPPVSFQFTPLREGRP